MVAKACNLLYLILFIPSPVVSSEQAKYMVVKAFASLNPICPLPHASFFNLWNSCTS